MKKINVDLFQLNAKSAISIVLNEDRINDEVAFDMMKKIICDELHEYDLRNLSQEEVEQLALRIKAHWHHRACERMSKFGDARVEEVEQIIKRIAENQTNKINALVKKAINDDDFDLNDEEDLELYLDACVNDSDREAVLEGIKNAI